MTRAPASEPQYRVRWESRIDGTKGLGRPMSLTEAKSIARENDRRFVKFKHTVVRAD